MARSAKCRAGWSPRRGSGVSHSPSRAPGKCGMVKLTPDQQAAFIEDHPKAFSPEAGAWGRNGCTRVILTAIDEDTLGEALTLAWRNTRKVQRKKCR